MDRYGLIGYPLGHSFSKSFFTDKFASEGINAEYVNFELPTIEDFLEIVSVYRNIKGLNITIPYKEKVIPYLDTISKEAREIGAVNIVKVERHGGSIRLIGHNSDYIGFKDSIEPLLKPHHKKALILGTGGASKAIHYTLTKILGMETVFVSRYERPGTVTYKDIDENAVREYEVIVNCTPVGMFPNNDDAPALPYDALTEKNLLFDLVYNPDVTRFMQLGAAHGAQIKNGLEMLILQAMASWNFWNE
ncbi:MAG: shikimate dehydrogenase [Bacteroidaceae bacterium]|nr:shikimate dehydrogenase [Bacteroidaceae bacterium]MDO4995209.1 shikimate dehydrogenase [Bacteroidales bacterium]